MPEAAFGILAALPFIGALLQLPASYMMEKHSFRRRTTIIGALVSRSCWVVVGLLPWVLPLEMTWPMMLLLVFFAWAAMHCATPGWISWMADLVPDKIRGRFLGKRRSVGMLVGVFASLAVGWMLDVVEKAGNPPQILLMVTSSVFMIAGLLGVIEVIGYARLILPDKPAPKEPYNWLSSLSEPLKSKSFRYYLAFNIIFIFSIGYIGQYIWLYAFESLKLENWVANLLLVTIPLLISGLVQTAWGKLMDRVGKKPVMIITVFLCIIGPLGWLLCMPGDLFMVSLPYVGEFPIPAYVPGYLFVLVAVAAYPGFDLANFNILIGISGTGSKGSVYVAVNSICAAVAGALSGIMATIITKYMGDFTFTLPLIDRTYSYLAFLLILASVIRVFSLPLIWGIEDSKAAPVKDTLRFMTTSVYSNIRQAVLMPTRVAVRLRRRTYDLETPCPQDETVND